MKELNQIAQSLGITHIEYTHSDSNPLFIFTDASALAAQFSFYRNDGQPTNAQQLIESHPELGQEAKAFFQLVDANLPSGTLDALVLNTQKSELKEFDTDRQHRHHAFVFARLEELGARQLEMNYSCLDSGYGVDLLRLKLKDKDGQTISPPSDVAYIESFLTGLALAVQSMSESSEGGEGGIRIDLSNSEVYKISAEHHAYSISRKPLLQDQAIPNTHGNNDGLFNTLNSTFAPNVYLDVGFSGSDDSCDGINIQVYTKDQDGHHTYLSSEMPDDVLSAIEAYIWETLATVSPDWESDQGGEGTLTIDIAQQAVYIDAYALDTETQTFNYDWPVIQTLNYQPDRDSGWVLFPAPTNDASPSPSM